MVQERDQPRREGTGRRPARALREGWTAIAADDEVRRAVVENRTDDVGPWHDVSVPGEWRSVPAFADHAGAVVYRTCISRENLGPGERLFVECAGIFDQADLWYDGAYLGDQEDPFLPGRHEFGELARLEGPGIVVVEVNGRDRAGPWLPVSLLRTGPVSIEAMRVLCRDASDERAHLVFVARLDAASASAPVVRTSIGGRPASERVHHLARGANTITWSVDVDRPALWWPRSLGEPSLTDVVVEVDLDGLVSDSAVRRTGIRQISADHWQITVNGERIHAKGAYLDLPEDARDAADPDQMRAPVRRALEAGLDLVRVRRHVAHPHFYDAVDEAGLLLWQDVPPRPPGRARGRRGRRRAERVAAGLVDLLGHHPSVALWHHDVSDRWTHRGLVRADPTRTTLAHLSTAVPSRAATDPRTAILRGALAGVTADLAAAVVVVPNIARFPTVEQWRLVAPGTGALQPDEVRADLETLRSVRFRPSAGFCHVKLQDSSVLDNEGMYDHAGRMRPLGDAVHQACAPVIVAFSAGRGPAPSEIGVVVVNDTRLTWDGAMLEVSVSGAPWRSFSGTVAADEVTFVASLPVEDLRALGIPDPAVEAVLVDPASGAVIARNLLVVNLAASKVAAS